MIVALRFARDRRRWTIWWLVGMAGGLLLSVAFYPSIKEQAATFDDFVKDLPEGLKALAGAQGDVSLASPAGYLHSQMFTQVLPILLLVFGIALGARAIGAAEDDGTLELMLANPVTRRRVAVERYLSAIGLVVFFGVLSTLLLIGMSAPFELLEGVSIAKLIAACAAWICFGVFHASLAFAVGAAVGGRGRAIAGASVIAVAGFLLFGIVSADVLLPARFVTPWWWYISRNIVDGGLPPEAILVPLALSAVLAFVGVLRFEARDLRS